MSTLAKLNEENLFEMDFSEIKTEKADFQHIFSKK